MDNRKIDELWLEHTGTTVGTAKHSWIEPEEIYNFARALLAAAAPANEKQSAKSEHCNLPAAPAVPEGRQIIDAAKEALGWSQQDDWLVYVDEHGTQNDSAGMIHVDDLCKTVRAAIAAAKEQSK